MPLTKIKTGIIADGQITPSKLDVAKNDGTGATRLPNGTTAQRPVSPTSGMLRFNSTTNYLEYYGTEWSSIASTGIVTSSLILHLDPTTYTAGASTWTDSIASIPFTVNNNTATTKPSQYIIDDSSGSTYFRYNSNWAPAQFGTNPFTLEMWIYLNTTNYTSWRYLGGKSTFWDANSFGLYISDTGTAVGFHTTSTNGVQVSLSTIGTGWKHITAVRHSGGRRLYINGSQYASDSVVDSVTSTAGLSFGCDQNGGYSDATYKFGNYRMYSKALNDQEVQQNFSYERSRFGV